MNHLLILKSLLFMNFGEQMFIDYATQNCSAVNTHSFIGRCNRVCNFSAVTDEDVQAIKEYFGTTHFTWATTASDIETIKKLIEHGLQHKASSPGMFADLHQIKDNDISDQIMIKEVMDERDLLAWVSIVSKNYGYNEIELAKAIRFLLARAQGMLKLYIGYYQNKPAATSMVAYHYNKMVSVHLVGTLSECRNKGLGSAILYKPLLQARDQGYKSAVLMSSALGLRLAQKLGFKEYATYIIYGNY